MPLHLLLALSGAAALTCEVVWMRRLSLTLGSTGLATTLTLSVYMLGLGLGARAAAGRRWRHAPREYGVLELGAAAWALAFPALAALLAPLAWSGGLSRDVLVAALLLLPPGLLHGATLPAISAAVEERADAARLYAANTAGALVGVLVATFLLMPVLGIRGTELAAAALAATVGVVALGRPRVSESRPLTPARAPARVLVAVAVAGGAAMALEVAWSRLGTLLIGGSVYAFATVLAVFLAGIALGARAGARRGELGSALLALAVLALVGAISFPFLPHLLGLAYSATGPSGVLPAGAALLALAMCGAPFASGVVFSTALREAGGEASTAAGQVLAANTVGAVLGAALAGLVGLPVLGILGTVKLAAGGCALVGIALLPRRRIIAAVGVALLLVVPRWDPQLYGVGLYARLDQFADLSPRAVSDFAHEGWELLHYGDGRSATVAVGESTTTGRRWLSINGKVDASDGDDMPTQVLSGQIPVELARQRKPTGELHVLVVGLASGVTARAALDAGATRVTVVELEPEMVTASHFFDHVNGDVLDDPRVELIVDDARAVLSRPGPLFDVIISEPSNPWLTGVSNLFTHEYWSLAQARLAPDGVFCQWLQLYALPPAALRGLHNTFRGVFGPVLFFETIPGADMILISPPPGELELGALSLAPSTPVDAVAHWPARINTDDDPWIEFEAPKWLLHPTAAQNREMLFGPE